MKRFLFTIGLMGALVIFMEPAQVLLSRFLRLDEPTTYEIQQGDWLSKIALRYYGNASYWRELKLINRAPNGDRIFPGEQIVVPSFAAIQEIRRARALSDVNELLSVQEDLIAGRIEHRIESMPEPEPTVGTQAIDEQPVVAMKEEPADAAEEEPADAPDEPEIARILETPGNTDSEADVTPFWLSTPFVTGVVVLAVVLVVGIFLYARRKEDENTTGENTENTTDYETDDEDLDDKNNFLFKDYGKETYENESDKETSGKERVAVK